MSGDKPKMVMLVANNYEIRKTKMLDLLYVKILARPIEELGIRSSGADVREWSDLDQRCLEHLNQLEHLFNQLTAMGVDFNDEVQALSILGSLPDSWETFSVSLSASAPDGTISKEMVSNTILSASTWRTSRWRA
ncbi:hypothetical protein LIER_34071 [Lithospermum erythrorhizon]|uniref:Uncharacterized protein n=1 Tax=Lithospermum erythrorhizon TaxID=34254 RepID=A0AAV3RYL6_LITER